MKVGIVGPNRLSREGLVRLFDDSRFRVVLSTATVPTPEDLHQAPDSVDLLLVTVPQEGPPLAAQLATLRNGMPDLRIVVLSDTLHPPSLADHFEAGVDGYLLSDISTRALLGSLVLVMAGERVFPSRLIPLILRDTAAFSRRDRRGGMDTDLSDLELDILGCLVDGNPNKLIANRLGLAEATIKAHLKCILRKIRAENRTQAAIWALHNGLGRSGIEAA